MSESDERYVPMPAIDGPTTGRVLLASVIWALLAMGSWVVAIFVIGGGPAAVNLIFVGFAFFWGPVLGLVAGLTYPLTTGFVARAAPRILAHLVGAALGWTLAFLIWAVVINPGAPAAAAVTAAAAAFVGAALSLIVGLRSLSRNGPDTS